MLLCWLKTYLFLWTVSVCSGISQIVGHFESINNLAGEEETLVLFKLRLIGKERLMNGTVQFLTGWDENSEVKIEIYSFKNGEWNLANIKLRTTPCDAILNFVRKYLIPPEEECTLPLGMEDCHLNQRTFYFKSVKLNSDEWPPFLPRGLIKCAIHSILNGKRVGGLEVVYTVSDKHI